jgi:capsular exopolysaccharide synthesis family protein
MGRVAEALKKAEQQRRQKPQDGGAAADPIPASDPQPDACGAMPIEKCPVTRLPQTESPKRVEGMSESLAVYYEPSSVISEQYRGLRTRFLSQNPDNEHRIIAVTSGAPRDGKSVTALNTAFSLSEIRHLKVLVVDGDFRRGSLAEMLQLPDAPGLAEVLQGAASYEEALQETPMPNMYFMPAGHTQGRSAAELLSGEATGAVMERFRHEFHYTIVDTPPATTVTDVGIIGQWCSGVVMVVRINKTPEPIAQRAVRVLQVNNVPIIGVVLVGDESRAPGYGSYRYYNYYQYYYYKGNGGGRGRR